MKYGSKRSSVRRSAEYVVLVDAVLDLALPYPAAAELVAVAALVEQEMSPGWSTSFVALCGAARMVVTSVRSRKPRWTLATVRYGYST